MASSIYTLGGMIDHGYTLHVYCETWGCGEGRKVDLERLAARYGREHGAMHQDLVGLPWKCQKCGGRKVSFRIAPGAKQYTFHQAPDPDEPF
jgi:hypothetical protein